MVDYIRAPENAAGTYEWPSDQNLQKLIPNEVNMSIRWFASLYPQNYQKWGKISPIHAPRDSTPALGCHADMHALCTYVCVCVPVHMCVHGTLLACIHDQSSMHVFMPVCLSACLPACLPVCLSVSFAKPCVCMHVSMHAGRYVGMYVWQCRCVM